MTNKEIIKNLQSNNNSIILETLEIISKEGNSIVLEEVLKLLLSTSDTTVRDKIILILDNLREPSCVPVISNAINNPDFEELLSILVSSCWKNSLNFNDYIELFTEVFINSDFQLAFDAFTVIENFDYIEPELADVCLLKLENAVENIKDDKKLLFFELINVIKQIKENPAN